MSTLFLAWQDANSTRSWYPIGKLEAESSQGPFRFTYIRGAEKANRERNMPPLESFPDFHQEYLADKLFPLFSNRVLNKNRADFAEYLKMLDLDPANADPLEILAISEGVRQTDGLEVFPKIQVGPDGSFRYRFFLHGLRHVNDASRKRIDGLESGELLRAAIELNNPATGLAVQLQTADYQHIGWAPRYLVIDLIRIINERYRDIQARIVQVNKDFPASIRQRVLIELTGFASPDYESMSSEDFQSLALT